MSPSRCFLFFCLFFILGIFLSSFLEIGLEFLLVVVIAGLILVSVFWKYKKAVIFGFCLLFSVLGIWRHQLALSLAEKSSLSGFIGEAVNLTAYICQEPLKGEKTTRLVLETEKIGGVGAKAKILATVPRYPDFKYGQKLVLSGRLEKPSGNESFDYEKYLAKDGIYATMNFPDILAFKEHPESLYGKILSFKEKLREGIYENVPPPQGPILGAIVLGDKEKISDEWNQKLSLSGIRHITAISGMNFVLLAGFLTAMGLSLGLGRGQIFYFVLAVLVFYLVLTGLESSSLRAVIMAFLFLLAQKVGRLSSGGRAVVFAASLMLFMNPLLLKWDVGFQLSFLAVLGMIYLAPFFRKLLGFLPDFRFFPLASLLGTTLSAQVFTLPVLLSNFGYVSLASPFSNLLIAPVVAPVMILGICLALLGLFAKTFAWILSLPRYLLMAFITANAEFFSQPIFWQYLSLPRLLILFFCLALIASIFFYWKKRQQF